MSEVIKIDTATSSITLGDVVYEMNHLVSWTINNPVENDLIVAPNDSSDGIAKKTNTSQPVMATGVVRELTQEYIQLLTQAYKNQTRFRFVLFDIESGRQEKMDNAILATDPTNFAVSDSDDTFNTTLVIKCAGKNRDTQFLEV